MKIPEPTHPLPNPRPEKDGTLRATAKLSPKANTTRASLAIPPDAVIPVIFVPGIMGSNLCATRDRGKIQNTVLRPGEQAWRPPNGAIDGLMQADTWSGRNPGVRQRILDFRSLDVDRSGKIDIPKRFLSGLFPLAEEEARERGWGEIHWASYGEILCELHQHLNQAFISLSGERAIDGYWRRINRFDRKEWGGVAEDVLSELNEMELLKVARFNFPIYAYGYNWLDSNETSSTLLCERVESIVEMWEGFGKKCPGVVLVTHSMGGLVARACAKKIPQKIFGVIHGVMPALGAPICYRRIACGTESSSPTNNYFEDVSAGKFADIAGRTAADTTAVMGTAPGPLELLPTHRYKGRWLFATVQNVKSAEVQTLMRLPIGDPYEMYRDMDSWHRLINPEFLDPAGILKNRAVAVALNAIGQAEKFHKDVLGDYYHPNTFSFWANDAEQQSAGACSWVCTMIENYPSSADLIKARPISYGWKDGRNIEFQSGRISFFNNLINYTAGDGTVPADSGAAPREYVRNSFELEGFDHQGSYLSKKVQFLVHQLIAKMVSKL